MGERKRILFVEDDASLLAVLRETMADMAPVWNMTFVDNGETALDAFEKAPFHAVVSELAMPGMNGAQLLQRIMARYPATQRFALCGGDDRALPAEVVDRAHQILGRPFDPAFLKSVLRRSFHLGSQVRNGHARDLVTRIGRLPSVPDLYVELTRLMGSERATLEDLGAAIGKDVAMTAMVLKLANSAFFSVRQEVATPAEAVSLLGVDLLRSLVLAHGLFSQSGGFRFPGFGLAHLWRHSVAVASATKQIAEMQGLGQAVSAEHFTAGLLHDVGILVLASRLPDAYAQVLDLTRAGGADLEATEFHVLGATHGEVGAYLLGLWGLPPAVVEAAAWHHQPGRQGTAAFTPALGVHIADSLTSRDPEHELFSTAKLDEPHLRSLGLWERVPAWSAGIEPDPAGLRDLLSEASCRSN